MRHVRNISAARIRQAASYDDFLNTFWNAWLNFLFSTKNSIGGLKG